MNEKIKGDLKSAFGRDRVICRLIAAWCAFAATILLCKPGSFADLSFAQNVSLLTLALVTALFFLLFSALAVLLPAFPTDSWFLLVSASIPVFFWLLNYDNSTNDFLFLLACFAVYILFVLWFIHENQELIGRWKPGKKTQVLIVTGVALVSCVIIALITCLRYRTFSSPNFDFGLFCNMFHNMKKTGLPLITSERDRLLSHFAVHISPIYYLLLPFFWIFPSPLTLQIGQAVLITSGIIPVVLIAKHYGLSGKVTILCAAIYAFYPALSTGCFYDIHENCFLPPLLLWMFCFFEKKRYIPMYIFALLTLTVKEDAAIYLIFFALYVVLSRKNYLHGVIIAAMAGAYFALSAYLLKTYGLGMMVNRFDNLIYDKGDGLFGAIKTAFLNPGFLLTQLFTTSSGTWQKLQYFFQLMLPLGLLPFFTKKPSRWLLAAPILMNFLTYYQYQYDIGFQYHFGISAFLFYAMIQNLADLKPITRQYLLSIAAAGCCCIYVASVLPVLNTYTARWNSGKETYRYMEEILDTLPEDASLCVSTMLLAHVADHDIVYEVAYHDRNIPVDYVVLDARYENYEKYRILYELSGYEVTKEYEGLMVILCPKASE